MPDSVGFAEQEERNHLICVCTREEDKVDFRRWQFFMEDEKADASKAGKT